MRAWDPPGWAAASRSPTAAPWWPIGFGSAYGFSRAGIPFQAIDGKPVHHLFLIVAPPLEISNQYLPVLGRIAQFAKEPDVPDRLAALTRPEDFLRLLEEKGV